jgi:hypothetical protein
MFRTLSAWTARRAVPLAVLGVVTAAAAGTAAAAVHNNACPTAYETITVAQAVAEGRTTAVVVDTAGNGDGVVCRLLLGKGAANSPGTVFDEVYFWLDNSTPRNL